MQLVILPTHGSLYHAEQAINNILIVKKFVTSITPIFDALLPAQSVLLRQIRGTCRPGLMQPIRDLIDTVIDENSTFVKTPLELRHQRTYAVKVRLTDAQSDKMLILLQSNINGLLDVARKTYKEATDDFYEYVGNINSKCLKVP